MPTRNLVSLRSAVCDRLHGVELRRVNPAVMRLTFEYLRTPTAGRQVVFEKEPWTRTPNMGPIKVNGRVYRRLKMTEVNPNPTNNYSLAYYYTPRGEGRAKPVQMTWWVVPA